MGKWEGILLRFMDAIQLVLSEGEELPDEFVAELAETLQLLMQRVQQEKTPTGPTKPPEITEAMPSSNVEGFAYDPEKEKLFVRFLGPHPQRNGPIYSYEGVPENIVKLFIAGSIPARTDGKNKWGKWWKGKVPSIGASLYTLIKTQGYPYQRLT